jgi:membrane associated rhomboid family serine protease
MSGVLLEPLASRPISAVSWHGPSAVRRGTSRVTDTAPLATVGVVAALVVVWFFERAFSGQVHGGRSIGYLAFGGLPNADIIGRGSPAQLWRWVSSGLVHDHNNPLHLVSNSLVLIMVGSVIERLYGRLVVLSCLALGVVAGSLTWLEASALGLAAQPDYTIGLSAGICALIGVLLVYGYRERLDLSQELSQAMKAQAALGIGMMALIGLVVPNLNNIAHVGGLVAGALIALCLPTRRGERRLALGWRTQGAFLIVLALSTLSVLLAVQNLIVRLLPPA